MSKSVLPPAWLRTSLGDICTLEYGKTLKSGDRVTEGQYPVFGSNGVIGYHDQYFVEAPFIIVGRKGSAGKITLSMDNGFPIDTTFYIKCDEKKICTRFLYELLIALRLENIVVEAGVPGLNRNIAYQEKIVLPPLPEQKAIAKILQTWDTAIEKTEALIAAKERRFAWLATYFLAEHDALHQTLSSLFGKNVTIEKGKPLTKGEVGEGNVPVIAGGKISPYSHKEATHTTPCITVSTSGAHAGYVSYHDRPIWASDCNVIYSKIHSVKYLYYALKAQQNKIYALQVGGGQPHVYAKDMKKLSIPLPPLPEQKRIVCALNTAQCEINLLKDTTAHYHTQKLGLMQKLLSGAWKPGSKTRK